MPQVKKYGVFSSSVDSTQLSLTVQSVAKVLIGLVGYYAAFKGLDQAAVTSNLQNAVDTIVTLIPVAYSAFYGLETVWGLLRKVFVAFSNKSAPVASQTVAVTP